MADSFSPGDTVQLKSGGPVVTVTHVDDELDETMVYCVWFGDKNTEKRGGYPSAALKVANT